MKLGVIGGSGLYNLAALTSSESVNVDTPFGRPSDDLRIGKIGAVDVVFLARHGAGHRYSPSDLPYRANIYALKQAGVTHVVSISAVGSLREQVAPRSVVLPDQIIDRTVARPRTYFDRGVVAHVGLADPFCPVLCDQLGTAGEAIGHDPVDGGTYVCIEGPQFSTRAESQLYRSWGGTVIGMTAMPEARLAREAELCYAMMAMVTDYDVWHDDEADVSVDLVQQHLRANLETSSAIITGIGDVGLPERTCACADALQHALITDPQAVSEDHWTRLGVIGARYFKRDSPTDA